MAIDIETIDQLIAHNYSVSTFCPRCKRHGPDLDLVKYAAQDKGHLRPVDLKVKHRRCRTVLEITINPEKGFGK